MGIADYDNVATETVLIKLETGLFEDYYMNFNRKSGINAGTQEGGDQVLISSQGANGKAFSKSTLHAILSEGQSFEILNFGGIPLYSVKIKVDEINLSVYPAYADVTISARQNVYVNCGGPDYYDGATLWKNDTTYVNTGRTYVTAANITNTDKQELYKSERYDLGSAPDMIYTFGSIADGYYDISLHLAECWGGAFRSGVRVFDVMMEDTIVMEAVDIFNATGAGNKAYVRTVTNFFVSGGSLSIKFLRIIQNPKISAIEVHPSPGIFINAGGPSFNDGTRLWRADIGYFDAGTDDYRTTRSISNTDKETLYQTERYDRSADAPNMIYSVPGRYRTMWSLG